MTWATRVYNFLTEKHLFFKNEKNISETYEITKNHLNKNVI